MNYKKAFTGSLAVAALAVMMVPTTSDAWFVKAKNEMNRVSALRDANAGSRSFNRRNSHNISRSKNIMNERVDQKNEQGQIRDLGHGTAKNARVAGDWSNAGGSIGHVSSQTFALGDNVNTGNTNTYMGTDALETINEESRIQAKKEVDLKRLETSRSRYRSVR